MRPSLSFVALFLCAACNREPESKPAVIDARPASAAPTVAAPTVAAPAAAAVSEKPAAPAPVYEPGNPLTTPSLEISGEVAVAPEASPPQKIFIYLSSGDCLDSSAPLLRRMPVTENGTFLAHIVAEPNTDLTLCSAADFGPGRPSTLYGKYAKPIHVGPQREQELREVKVNLALAPAKQFPTPKK